MTNGFIIAVPEKYQEICYLNILHIRFTFNIHLPIEIWQIGQEISEDYLCLFSKISNLTFKNVSDYTDNPMHWKGFQIKAFILKFTDIMEPILCDADIIFYTNPLVIYKDNHYIETGTYFFRDLDTWKFHNLHNSSDKFQSIDFYNIRKGFILSQLPNKTHLFPKEWEYLYETDYPLNPVNEAYQESGVVYINKLIHADVIDIIYQLNYHHEYVYQFIWGDKETFWLACLIANKKYYINDTYAYISSNNKLSHNYNNCLFFSQK